MLLIHGCIDCFCSLPIRSLTMYSALFFSDISQEFLDSDECIEEDVTLVSEIGIDPFFEDWSAVYVSLEGTQYNTL